MQRPIPGRNINMCKNVIIFRKISIAKKVCGYNVHGYTVMNTNENYEERELVESTVKFLKIKHLLQFNISLLKSNLNLNVTNFSVPIVKLRP